VSVNTNAADVQALSVQRGLAGVWAEIDKVAEVSVVGSIEEAVGVVRGLVGREGDGGERGERDEGGDGEVRVLVTGSVHLVGGFLEVLESGQGEGSGVGGSA